MTLQTKRTTIYFDPLLHEALKLKSSETSLSVSELVNRAVREALSEDAEDMAAFDERKNEPLITYDDMIRRLKEDGRENRCIDNKKIGCIEVSQKGIK